MRLFKHLAWTCEGNILRDGLRSTSDLLVTCLNLQLKHDFKYVLHHFFPTLASNALLMLASAEWIVVLGLFFPLPSYTGRTNLQLLSGWSQNRGTRSPNTTDRLCQGNKGGFYCTWLRKQWHRRPEPSHKFTWDRFLLVARPTTSTDSPWNHTLWQGKSHPLSLQQQQQLDSPQL